MKCRRLPTPKTDAQWIGLAVLLALATCVSLRPIGMLQARLIFAKPTRADLLLPGRNSRAHHDRQYRQLLDKVHEEAPRFCGDRDALFAQNFILVDSAGYETRVDADFVHLCGVDDAAGLSAAGLTFEAAPGASQVVCGEEYVDFQEKVRPSSGWMHYADVGKDWLSVKRLTRSASEACLAQHAVEVLAGVWARK